MKIEFVLCVVAMAAYVHCEVCTTDSNCVNSGQTNCNSGSHVVCFHQDTSNGIQTNGGLCTCVQTDLTCTYLSDCKTPAALAALNCPFIDNIHCYDNQCICSNF